MSGIYVSSGTHEARVEASGAVAVVDSRNHTITVEVPGQTFIQVQATTKPDASVITMHAVPSWLAWLFGERLKVTVRLKG